MHSLPLQDQAYEEHTRQRNKYQVDGLEPGAVASWGHRQDGEEDRLFPIWR
jgi:hypothetical protein